MSDSTSAHHDLLVEIGTEELPAAAQAPLAEALARKIDKTLTEHGLHPQGIETFSTPRRLAVLARGVPDTEPERTSERKGPSVKAAFDANGRPTRAAEGFARSAGVAVDQLPRLKTAKGEWLVHRETVRGRALADVLKAVLPEVLTTLPLKRRMRWGAGEASFLRPVRWLLVRRDEVVIPIEAFGLTAGGTSLGHRFHHPDEVHFETLADYPSTLESTWVIASPIRRRAEITRQVEALAHSLSAESAAPDSLFEEITGLVEWPVAVAGEFDVKYLELPEAVLITTLAHHQRFIPLRETTGRLSTHFIAVMNLQSRDPAQLRAGLERVVRPRLEDAEFYYRRDRERPLAEYATALESLAFGAKLGSMAEKSTRLEALAGALANAVGTDSRAAARAGRLAKCDLVTGMVFEFPELQGIMGGHYAAVDGEGEAVADAIAEQYLPAGAGGALPRGPAGAALALADRLDTLVGGFASGRQPTGTKDAFGLRRAAFGLLRIAAESAPELDLDDWLEATVAGYPDELDAASSLPALREFLRDRLRSMLLDAGHATDVVLAVLAVARLKPAEALTRAKAVAAFRARPEAEALAAANKRIANILRQAGELPSTAGVPHHDEPPAQTALAQSLAATHETLQATLAGGDFDAALLALSRLREPVDQFFDEVLVMDPDSNVRARRLTLLSELRAAFLRVADIGELQGKSAQ
jgi:glycyl-tRNA synthetase beta chain